MTALALPPLALGSWQTFDRLSDPEGEALLAAALDAGVRFFDVARYTPERGGSGDETATERAFARFFSAAGFGREGVTIASKAWSDRRPAVDLRGEVAATIERLQVGRLDLLYLDEPPGEVPTEALLEELAELLEERTVGSWGLMAWPAQHLRVVDEHVASGRVPRPAAAQLPYNVLWRQPLDSPDWDNFLERHGTAVVASAPLAYGALTGKYRDGGGEGRLAAAWPDLKELVAEPLDEFMAVAARTGVEPAHLAIAFALAHPKVTTVLFGARTPEQVRRNVAALEVAASIGQGVIDELRPLRTIG